ncbi:MAG TPA: immunoglobulin domain-containing protein [Pirellulales bacterium]|nr:immunoglobulin domain-containing protein [Pirellulales bacterium]
MFKSYLRRLAKIVSVQGQKRRSRRSKWNSSVLEHLELRNMLSGLAWSAGANLPGAAAGLVAQPDGANLLIMGGPSTTSYDLSAAYPSWQASASPTVQPLDFARNSPGVSSLPNGLFLVFGGLENGFATSAVTQYDPYTVSVVDGTTNQTRSLRSMNVPRAEFGWATDANDLSYAIGGQDNNGTPLATMEVYDPTANTWTYLASLPQTLYGESAIGDGAGHIYTFGGVGANGQISNVVYRYTIASNTWDTSASPMQVGLRDSAAVVGPNGLIYLIGGETASGASATVESYSISTNTWNLETSLPQPLSSAAVAVDSLGRIEVLGGNDANGNPVATTYVSQEFTQPDLAPAITSAAPTTGVLDTVYTYQVTSTGNPQPTYSLTDAPAGMTIDASTGLINWTPTAVGSYSVTIQATSSVGQDSQTFPINVFLPAPAAPTGLTGQALSTTSIGLSWNASTDPNVTSYDVYMEVVHVYHSPKGSGGGRTISWPLVASGIDGTSATVSQSGTYAVTAVNNEGIQSPRSTPVSVSVATPPDLYVATTTSGADISSLTLSVGQTGQIDLIQTGANPAPTFSVVSGPGGVSVDANTGLVTYTPLAADIGLQPVVFAATNSAGTSQYTFYFDVVALTPAVSVTGGEFTYDGNPHPAGATALETDGVTPVAGTLALTYDGSSTPPTDAGTYAVAATFTSADPSYANATATGTITIDPATPTITVGSGPFDYDGNAHAATAIAVGGDGATPVAGDFTFTYDGASTPPSGPGLYTVAATFTSSDPNYVSTTVTSNLIINSPGTQTPVLSLVDGSSDYDGNQHSDSATAVGADGVTPVDGNFVITYDSLTTAPTQAGSYAVVATFISSDVNYANATVTGTMTISAVAPTISIDPSPCYYNGTGQAAVVSALGADGVTPVAGTLNVTYNGSATLPVNAGTYEVEVAFTSSDPNYLSTSAIGSITVLPATPSVGLGNDGQWEFTYNGLPQSVVGSAVGIDGVTPIAGTFTYEYYNEYGSNTQLFGPPLPGAPTDAGYYTFIEYFTSQNPNYADGSFSWSLYIFPASATATFDGGPFTYNGQAQGGTVSAVGVDGVTPLPVTVTYITYDYSTTVPNAAGTYSVFAEFTVGDPNYYSSTVDGTLEIDKATPAFSGLSSPAVTLGASTVTVSGQIAAGSTAPTGDDVAITLNGVTEATTIGTGGRFSETFNIQGLAAGTYSISYEYLGDAAHFNGATDGSGTLTVRAAPSIVTNPVSQAVVSGTGVTFSAAASGSPVPTVQWQQSSNGTTYTNIAGATGLSYTIASVTPSQNGYHYRAVFTNSAGSATTAAATLTVASAPSVTTNPRSATVNAGQTATFTVAASGNPTPTAQWQVSTDGGKTFTNISGATSTTLTISATAAQNGSVYHAVFTNSVSSVTTANATLTVRYAPAVSGNPVDQTVAAGQTATFTAAASGNPIPTVQWQVSTNGGTSFSNISGATHLTLTLTNTTASQNGYLYRAVFHNSIGSITTAVAMLTVQAAPAVTQNPASQTASAGQNVALTAAATSNTPLTVQWQVSTDGGKTYTSISGATSATLALSGVSTAQSGYRYRAVFTNSIGSTTTTAATLTVA